MILTFVPGPFLTSGGVEGGSLPGRRRAHALCLNMVTTGEQRPLEAKRHFGTWEPEQGQAHLDSPPVPRGTLQGCPSAAPHTRLGELTHLEDVSLQFLNSRTE